MRILPALFVILVLALPASAAADVQVRNDGQPPPSGASGDMAEAFRDPGQTPVTATPTRSSGQTPLGLAAGDELIITGVGPEVAVTGWLRTGDGAPAGDARGAVLTGTPGELRWYTPHLPDAQQAERVDALILEIDDGAANTRLEAPVKSGRGLGTSNGCSMAIGLSIGTTSCASGPPPSPPPGWTPPTTGPPMIVPGPVPTATAGTAVKVARGATVRGNTLTLEITAPGPGTATVRAILGGTVIARGKATATAARTLSLKAALTRAGRKRVRRAKGRSVALLVLWRAADGTTAYATQKVRLGA